MASVKTSAKNQMKEIQTAIGDLMNTKCKSKSSSTVCFLNKKFTSLADMD